MVREELELYSKKLRNKEMTKTDYQFIVIKQLYELGIEIENLKEKVNNFI
jgi:hypothetical protein